MQELSQWLQETFLLNFNLQYKIVITIITILFLWAVKKITLKIVFQRVDDVRSRYNWRKTTSYILFTIGFLLIAKIWFEGFETIATFFGLVAAGIAIALKEPLENLAGWAFIIWRKPFSVGDRIQIGDSAGDVIDIRIFQFTMVEIGNWVEADQSTGRIMHVPNGKIFRDVQANYSTGFNYIWNEIPVLVTFESDWKKAKEILTAIIFEKSEYLTESAEQKIKEASRKFLIFYSKLTPIVYTSVKDSGVMLTIRYLCDPRKRRGSEEEIWESILEEFAAVKDIDFAYPTTRYYNNINEGKRKPGEEQTDRPGN